MSFELELINEYKLSASRTAAVTLFYTTGPATERLCRIMNFTTIFRLINPVRPTSV